jgi:3-oxoacyl-[acyl-carrier-protein] synthase-3
MTKTTIGILGLGAYVPDRVVTNEEWEQHVDTPDEWILSRTGIHERRFAAPEQTTVDLAVAAAQRALDDARMMALDVDEIVVATDTPEVMVPDTAAFLQQELGAREIPAYDLGSSGCAGFVLALDIARSRVRDRRWKILVVGVELLSRFMDWSDRSTCVLFGDAAGAVIVGEAEGAAEILAVTAGTDGSQADILMREVGGSRSPFSLENARTGEHSKIAFNGREIFKAAVARMEAAAREVVAEAGLRMEDVALLVPHQANLRILRAVSRRLRFPTEKVFTNVQRFGNTGSASIPLGLTEARSQGRIQTGDLVLLTAFGAGFHWAAALLRF